MRVAPTRTSMPASRAWASVGPTAPISGSVKVTRGRAPVVGGQVVLSEDVGHRDRRLVHGDVRERALPGDVADGPHAVGDAEVVVDRYPGL
jgi:hypothetical protein